MTFIPMIDIPMTKSSMCRYSYKKSVEMSKHFNANRLQQNNKPVAKAYSQQHLKDQNTKNPCTPDVALKLRLC
jgi:hypothetical protein